MINMNKLKCLNGNMLKILAAIFMVIDHVGLMFFPSEMSWRIIGRLAFPIFAFMISEGAKYTKNKKKYFLLIFSLALICQIVYYIFDNSLYMCILVNFSISILLIYAMQKFKATLFSNDAKARDKVISGTVFVLSMLGAALLNEVLEIDYGFFGCMVPVFASLFDFSGIDAPESIKRVDTNLIRVLTMGVGLILLAIDSNDIQFFALLALIPLLLYSGERGKYRMKYFFYLFYPIHLVVLEGIYLLIYYF